MAHCAQEAGAEQDIGQTAAYRVGTDSTVDFHEEAFDFTVPLEVNGSCDCCTHAMRVDCLVGAGGVVVSSGAEAARLHLPRTALKRCHPRLFHLYAISLFALPRSQRRGGRR